MRIKRIGIDNFRLLKCCSIDMTDGLTLVVGKNNTGKTSLVVLLEKFLKKPNPVFNYSDFPVSLRSDLHNICEETDVDSLGIRLCLNIEYSDDDDLRNISEFMLDLDPERNEVNILFETRINKAKLLDKIPMKLEDQTDEQHQAEKRLFIERNISKYLETAIYAFDDFDYKGEQPYYLSSRSELEPKEFRNALSIINFQVIHARRNVASSDESGKSPLSVVTTQFFKKLDDTDDAKLASIKKSLVGIDKGLEGQYSTVFEGFLRNAGKFLSLEGLKVISDIEANALIGTSSRVIYGTADDHLPENLNGLGYLNILYLLLKVEMTRQEFESSKSDIKLLFIEEPEAHTHPQMQSVFFTEN